MDIRSAAVNPIVEHGETVRSYFMVAKDELRAATLGSFMEFICEFEVAAGQRLEPHYHDTHEFYYILVGNGLMQVEAEIRDVKRGDLVCIPRMAGHSIWSTIPGKPIRGLAFAVSFQEEAAPFVPTTLPEPRHS